MAFEVAVALSLEFNAVPGGLCGRGAILSLCVLGHQRFEMLAALFKVGELLARGVLVKTRARGRHEQDIAGRESLQRALAGFIKRRAIVQWKRSRADGGLDGGRGCALKVDGLDAAMCRDALAQFRVINVLAAPAEDQVHAIVKGTQRG